MKVDYALSKQFAPKGYRFKSDRDSLGGVNSAMLYHIKRGVVVAIFDRTDEANYRITSGLQVWSCDPAESFGDAVELAQPLVDSWNAKVERSEQRKKEWAS